ncbi:MAG: translocation/assembly module TamB domain-containing protein, partial [Deltaproteobacteria bacterium]|nr:translocation/assembly module TamB domain-containing protein [Deltaproteobacteria bacterium]
SIEGLFSLSDNKITVSNIEGKQRSLLYSGSLGVTLGQTPTEISLNAHLKSGTAEDLKTFIVPEIKTLDWSGPLEGNIALLGPIEKGYQQELTGQLNIKILNGTKLFGAEVESGQLIASMDKSTVTLSELALHSKQGKAVLFVDFNKKTELGTGTLKLTDSFLGTVDMTMGFKPGLVHINGAALESKAIVQSTITLNKSLPFQVQVSVPYGNLSTLFPKLRWLEDYQVQSGIRARAEGLLTELEKSTVSLELFPAIFHLGTLRLLSTKTVQASYQKETLHIGSTVFRSIHGDEIEISATATEKDIDLALNASADLWFLTHLDERIEGAYGDLKANIKLNGPWSNISTLGNIKIAPKSYISLRDYPPGLTQLEGNVELTGKNGIINLKGQASQGQFSLNGIIGLSNNFFDGIHLELSKMPIYYSTYLTGVATGHLDLEGPWAEPTLSGDINFSEVLFTKDLTPAELRAPRSRAKKQPLKLDITLASETPVRVESQSFNGDLKGNLRLTGTLNSPGLIGQLDVISGDVYFRNQYYHLAKARVNFDNPFRIAPNINVEASSLILGYDVTVRAEGELSKPKLFFSSRPSLPQTDLVSLIMFGFTTRDNKDNLGLARTAGLEALSIYSGFGDEVLKTLPNQTFDELRLGTLYNQTGGAVSSVVLGMQVFNGVRLRFHSALVQNSLGTREKRLELEKYISRHLRWRVVWNSEGITNYGDAGADLWLRWDY